jgi:short subunit dehydrogenase-like uncharacterized protein
MASSLNPTKETAMPGQRIAVYGASGHTGRKVLEELVSGGLDPILVGRDRSALARVENAGGHEMRTASLDDAASLRAAFDGAAAVINCVGPFQSSAAPVLAATLAAGAHYLDFAAEQEPVRALFEERHEQVEAAGVAAVPAMGFYGAIGDALAVIAASGLGAVEEITIAYAVEGWLMTSASRATADAEREGRWAWRDGGLELITDEPRYRHHDYPSPRGSTPVMEDYPLPEAITVPRNTGARNVHVLMAAATLQEMFSPHVPAPDSVSDEQRANSRFTIVATARDADRERRVHVTGRDIYGITAPIIVAATKAVLDSARAGVLTPSQAVDPTDLLDELAHTGLLSAGPTTRELAA